MLCFRFLLVSLLILAVVSCSTPPKRDVRPVAPRPSQPQQPTTASQQDYLKKAQDVFVQTGSETERNAWLVKAAEALQQQDECVKSLKLLQVLLPELSEPTQLNIARLVYSECLLQLATPQANEQAQQLIASISLVSGYEQRIYQLQASVFSQQHQWLKASQALLQTNNPEPAKSMQIWQWLQNLDSAELSKSLSHYPGLRPWLQLSQILHRYGLKPEQLIEQVADWQSRYAHHALATNLPADITLALQQQPLQAEKIAVLLPLSGRLASQGLALKEGILAAYLANLPQHQDDQQTMQNAALQSPRSLRFFDSALQSPEQLNALVADYDFVLGPLLKESISALSNILPEDKIMLALNRIDNDLISPDTINQTQPNFVQNNKEQYFFALAPEDEAEQLASYIKNKGYQHPIVFSADNSVTNRMADAFVARWKAGDAQAKQPDIAIFSDSKDMRQQAETLLDVAQSKARIKQMENVADVEVHYVERNRQDVDVIVLFANPEQTELLNPIIEASLSPFAAKTLAVFASSRSYSLDLNKNSLRDLRNLTFSDMPWMLPDHAWGELSNQTAELWPQRQDTLLRLFAMGYDAYELIDNLRQLKALPQLSKQGLTGELNVAPNGVLHRHLPLAKIVQDKVTLLAMD